MLVVVVLSCLRVLRSDDKLGGPAGLAGGELRAGGAVGGARRLRGAVRLEPNRSSRDAAGRILTLRTLLCHYGIHS